LSRAVVVPAAVAATAKPNAAIVGCCQCRGHRHRLCRRNRIRCSLRHHAHLATAFTAIVDAAVIVAACCIADTISLKQSLQAIAIAATTKVVAAVAIAFAAAIAAAIALASAVTIAAASTDVSAAVIIVVVVIVVAVIAVVASDITAAYAAAIALASAVAATTALIAVVVFALWCPAPCASLFWLIVVFTHPLVSSHRHHQPELLSS